MVTTKIATSTQKPEVPKTPWVKSLMFTYFFLAWGSSLSENGSIQPYRQTEDSELKYETVFSRVNIAATFDQESLFFFLNIPPIRAWLKIISYHATNRRCIIIQLRSFFFINELKKKIFNAVARERKSQSFIKKLFLKIYCQSLTVSSNVSLNQTRIFPQWKYPMEYLMALNYVEKTPPKIESQGELFLLSSDSKQKFHYILPRIESNTLKVASTLAPPPRPLAVSWIVFFECKSTAITSLLFSVYKIAISTGGCQKQSTKFCNG